MMHCINIESLAMTQRTDLFMRILKLGSKYYGVRINGIYLLEGNDDNGTFFQSIIKTCQSNLGITGEKRISEIHVDMQGESKSLLFYDGNVASDGVGDGNVIKFGKGSSAKFVSFIFGSVDEKFSINAIEFEPQPLGLAKG